MAWFLDTFIVQKTLICLVINAFPLVGGAVEIATKTTELKSVSPAESLLPMLLGLIVILFIIFLLAFLFKRFTNFSPAGNSIKIVETQIIGSKEKLMIIEVEQQKFLIGVTGQSISQLGELKNSEVSSLLPASEDKAEQQLPEANSHLPNIEPQTKGLNFNQVISHFLTGGRSTQKTFDSSASVMDKSA